MKMTKDEVINFFVKFYNIKKKNMTTIKDIMNLNGSTGYTITKNGKDFNVVESCILNLEDKKIAVFPSSSCCVNGIPIMELCQQFREGYFPVMAWSYFFTHQNQIFDFGEFLEYSGLDVEKARYDIDILSCLGYLNSAEDIEFYVSAQEKYKKVIPFPLIQGIRLGE